MTVLHMGITDDQSLCGILVTRQSCRGEVGVTGLATLKPQTQRYPIRYGAFDVDSEAVSGYFVMFVKRDQNAVIEGRST